MQNVIALYIYQIFLLAHANAECIEKMHWYNNKYIFIHVGQYTHENGHIATKPYDPKFSPHVKYCFKTFITKHGVRHYISKF